MKKILVTYATLSGSTAEVARVVAEEIAGAGSLVELLPLAQVTSLEDYRAVVLGAPMIMGWSRSALAFLRRRRQQLSHTPLALFATAMSLTAGEAATLAGVPVCLDPILAKPPQNLHRLSFREGFTSLSHYAAPMLKAAGIHRAGMNGAGKSRVVSMAFFGGKLDIYRLPLWAKLFVTLIVQAPAGDRRNWQAIRSWAQCLPEAFNNGFRNAQPEDRFTG
jgi:menaquinone-dependent protoporphyrinogen oxidase